jgi:hypothetical protein
MGGKTNTIYIILFIPTLLTFFVIYSKYMHYATQTFIIDITYQNHSNQTILFK